MIRDDDGFEYPLHGYVSESGVQDLVSNDNNVNAMGITSGVTKGPVEEYTVTNSKIGSCVDYEATPVTDGKGIRTHAQGVEGDSGGPVYRIRDVNGDKKAEVIHLISEKRGSKYGYYTDCSGQSHSARKKVLGIGSYYLANQYSIQPM